MKFDYRDVEEYLIQEYVFQHPITSAILPRLHAYERALLLPDWFDLGEARDNLWHAVEEWNQGLNKLLDNKLEKARSRHPSKSYRLRKAEKELRDLDREMLRAKYGLDKIDADIKKILASPLVPQEDKERVRRLTR